MFVRMRTEMKTAAWINLCVPQINLCVPQNTAPPTGTRAHTTPPWHHTRNTPITLLKTRNPASTEHTRHPNTHSAHHATRHQPADNTDKDVRATFESSKWGVRVGKVERCGRHSTRGATVP